MLRRSRLTRISVPKDINDWGRVQSQMSALTIGKCFDEHVLDKSIIPTMHLQPALFRLPIPKLEDTAKRYLAGVKAVVPPTSYEKTEAAVNKFVAGEGAVLHQALLAKDKAQPHTSYISEDWFDLYLSDRAPLPINYNPSLITRRDPDKADPLVRSAFWIAASVRWQKMFLDNTLKPEVFQFGAPGHYSRKDWFQTAVALAPSSFAAKVMAIGSQFMSFPLDMSQYHSLFNTTRVPGVEKDQLRSVGFRSHIIVNFRGHQFKVVVADENANVLPEEQIYARLKQIVDTNVTPAQIDAGWFTAGKRHEWAAARMAMERSPKNKQSLEAIDEAMFVLNLDLDTTADFETAKGARETGMKFLATENNRWWDKSLSVTVTKCGALGVEFEHSWGDGVAVLRYTVDCFNESTRRKSSTIAKNATVTQTFTQLEWEFTPELQETAKRIRGELTKEIKRTDYYVSVFSEFGKKDPIFKGKAKPDPYMQVAMQLAWWRLNKSTVSTYESASTAAFKRGRTECIRSATLESQAFCLIFDNPNASNEEKVAALIKATDKHAAISKDAKMGQGVDRHLFALKKMAERRPGVRVVPDVFADQSYATYTSNIISTSSLFSEALIGGGFGPVSPGYGVGYASADDMMIFNISSWKENGPVHSSQAFAEAIYAAAVDMHKLLSAKVTATEGAQKK